MKRRRSPLSSLRWWTAAGCLVLVGLLFSATPVRAEDPILADSGVTLPHERSWGIALGDLDGDGDLDAFVANTDRNPSRVWLNDGRGRFAMTGQELGRNRSLDVALGDLDGDGDLDAFVANWGRDQIWWNQGNGWFTPGPLLDVVDVSTSAALGDLDGDGDLDAFVTNWGENRIWWNQGDGRFAQNEELAGQLRTDTRWSTQVALGDLDGDGDVDAVVANRGRRRRRRQVVDPAQHGRRPGHRQPLHGHADGVLCPHGSGEREGEPGLVEPGRRPRRDARCVPGGGPALHERRAGLSGRLLGQPGRHPRRLERRQLPGSLLRQRDLREQGSAGRGVAEPGAPVQHAVPGPTAAGCFTRVDEPAAFQGMREEAEAVATGDIDGDGDLDAVVAQDTASNRVLLWLNDGAGAFKTWQSLNTLGFTVDVAVGDLDGDGALDVVAVNRDAQPTQIFLNRLGARFAATQMQLDETESNAAALADLDNDRDLDAIVGGDDGTRDLVVGRGGGGVRRQHHAAWMGRGDAGCRGRSGRRWAARRGDGGRLGQPHLVERRGSRLHRGGPWRRFRRGWRRPCSRRSEQRRRPRHLPGHRRAGSGLAERQQPAQLRRQRPGAGRREHRRRSPGRPGCRRRPRRGDRQCTGLRRRASAEPGVAQRRRGGVRPHGATDLRLQTGRRGPGRSERRRHARHLLRQRALEPARPGLAQRRRGHFLRHRPGLRHREHGQRLAGRRGRRRRPRRRAGQPGPETIWLNDGFAGFRQQRPAAGADCPDTESFGALGDLDGDGDLDAYFANRSYDGSRSRARAWTPSG